MEPVASGYGLIEGPVWDPEHGLYWSDVQHGGVYRLGRSGEVTTALRACHTGTNHVAGSASAARRRSSSLRQCAARSMYGPDSTLG